MGIISSIKIKRDIRNSTYISDKDFIKDKDIILNILNREININLFNICICNNSIILELEESILSNNISKLNNLFNNHKLYIFNKLDDNYRNSNFIVNNYLDDYLFDEIDYDYNSMYSPVEIETKVIGLWRSNNIKMKDYNNTLELLKYYGREFFNNELVNLIIYAIDL